MPASLTVQVRLGFSMGWRIWTPNEVGFYAKTLAHSYFILVILKSKFLKEMIWIVNYNLFMGTKKYHVFLEFLQFGMKSLEERCVWKKIYFITLFARHKKMTKAYFKKKQVDYKLVVIKASLAKAYPYKGDKAAVFRVYEAEIFKNMRLGLKNSFISALPKSNALRPRFRIQDFPKFSKSRSLSTKLINVKKKSFFKYVFKKQKKIRTIIRSPMGKFSKENSQKCKKIETSGISRLKYFTKTNTSKLRSSYSYKKSDFGVKLGLEDSCTFTNDSEKTLLESFRFDPIYMRNNYSLFGGPRKRLSRNLRRAFKGKHVKLVADLIWFWEKISRMISYLVQKHILERKRII